MPRYTGKTGSITGTAANIGITEIEAELSCDVIDVTGMDSNGAKEYLAGLKEFRGSFRGFVNGNITAMDAGTVVSSFTLNFAASGGPKISNAVGPPAGQLILSNVRLTSRVDGAVEIEAQFQGSGMVTLGVTT